MSALAPIVLAAGLYAWGAGRARRSWPAGRGLAAVAGLVALAVALGPLDGAADRHLSAHMVQHVLIGVVAPALVAASAPVRLTLAALPTGGRRALGRVLNSRPAHVLAQPFVAMALACAVLVLGHLPAGMQALLDHPVLHDLEHAALFWAGLAAWMTVLGVDPLPAAPGPIGLLVVLSCWMIAMATIGSQYATEDHVLIAGYAGRAGALADQHAAGTIMWLGGMATVAPVALLGCARGLWLEERRQRRRDSLEAAR